MISPVWFVALGVLVLIAIAVKFASLAVVAGWLVRKFEDAGEGGADG